MGGYVGTVKALLGCLGVDLNLGDRGGRSLLSPVAEAGCEDALRMLLDGANVDLNPVEGILLSRAVVDW